MNRCRRCGASVVHKGFVWDGVCSDCLDDKKVKHVRIIVIGPDGNGKSEIAKELSRRTGATYFKARSEKANFRGGGDRFLNELLYAEPRQLDMIEQFDLSFIMDRGYPCEFVYSKVFCRKTDLESITWADEQYAMLGTGLVLCTRSSYSSYDDTDYAGPIPTVTLKALDDAYREFLKTSKCRYHVLNVDDEDLARETDEVLTWWEDG